MSVVDDFFQNLVSRNGFRLTGALAIQLVDGGVTISGALQSTLKDTTLNKDLLKISIPVVANVAIGDIVVPLPNIP